MAVHMIREELSGFLSPQEIASITHRPCARPVFYDIETTGLSRTGSFIYLIGAASYQSGRFVLTQWFAPAPSQEEELTACFMKALGLNEWNPDLLIQFNGNSFDQPFLEKRCGLYDIPCPLSHIDSGDLYREIKPCKAFLGLPGLKQSQLERFLGLSGRESVDGNACIRLYRKYIAAPESSLRQIMLKHNAEDLAGLMQVLSLLNVTQLREKEYRIKEAGIVRQTSASGGAEEKISISFILYRDLPFELHSVLPDPFSASGDASASGRTAAPDSTLDISGKEGVLTAPLINGRLRLYHEDTADYNYLPDEDMAVPKSLSAFIDKKRRQKCEARSCYTWFECSSHFPDDRSSLEKYLDSVLKQFLRCGRSRDRDAK